MQIISSAKLCTYLRVTYFILQTFTSHVGRAWRIAVDFSWRIDGKGGLTAPGDGPTFVQNGETKKGREAARALAQRSVEKTHVFSVTGTLDPSTMELRK